MLRSWNNHLVSSIIVSLVGSVAAKQCYNSDEIPRPCEGDEHVPAIKIFLMAGIPSIVILMIVGVFFWHIFRQKRNARVYKLFPPPDVSQVQLPIGGPPAVSTAGAEMCYARNYPQSITSPVDSSRPTSLQSQLACPVGGPPSERSKEAATHYGYSLGPV